MKVLVTGSKGFIENLCIFLKRKKHEVLEVHRETLKSDIISFIKKQILLFILLVRIVQMTQVNLRWRMFNLQA